WEPKIYGFELSTEYPQSWRHRLLFSRYFGTNSLTPKYDVYSFGVLMLEVLCGRKPMITSYGVEEDLDDIIDPNLRKHMDTQSLSRFKELAYKCLKQQLVQRPTMDQIVKELTEVLELQREHANLGYSIAPDEGTSSNSLEIASHDATVEIVPFMLKALSCEPLTMQVKPEENMDQMQQLPTNDTPFHIFNIFTPTLLKLFGWRNKTEQYYMLSANEAFSDSVNTKLFKLKPSTESRFTKVAELLSTHGETVVLLRFRLSDMRLATKNFAETNCMYLDTNGAVYKAELDQFGSNSSVATKEKNNSEPSKKTTTVAIKRITNSKGGQGIKEFFAELEMRAYRHPNIVSLEGFLKKLQISRKDIELGTQNFNERNCVGSGRFWKAYKGELPFPQDNANASGRTTIIAKRWDSKFGQADHQFRTECNILVKCNHENVIALVGYCNELDEKIIVYKHMSKGSLHKYLNDANLTWIKRLDICIDVASGLEFLHQGDVNRKKVVHGDIKSHSILLNDDWKAKITNLELSSLDSLHQDMEHVSNNASTTFSYPDPQYKQGFLTEKSDIYSFGIILCEILCGRLACAEDCKDKSQSLGPLAKRFYEEKKLDELVFVGIKEQIGPESLTTFVDIAYKCLQDKSEERPTAHEVVIQLKKALDVQKDYEIWEAQLPQDYKEIIKMSKTPEIYSTSKRKDIYDTLSKGILIQEGKVWFSLGSNGERNEMIPEAVEYR
ncbi:hypothetical protein M8C21_018746, partial [Ambrosia artemisiifolia]